MTLDFATSKTVKVTMLEYVDEIIGSWDNACSELDDGYKAVSGRKRIAKTSTIMQYSTGIYVGISTEKIVVRQS